MFVTYFLISVACRKLTFGSEWNHTDDQREISYRSGKPWCCDIFVHTRNCLWVRSMTVSRNIQSTIYEFIGFVTILFCSELNLMRITWQDLFIILCFLRNIPQIVFSRTSLFQAGNYKCFAILKLII